MGGPMNAIREYFDAGENSTRPGLTLNFLAVYPHFSPTRLTGRTKLSRDMKAPHGRNTRDDNVCPFRQGVNYAVPTD